MIAILVCHEFPLQLMQSCIEGLTAAWAARSSPRGAEPLSCRMTSIDGGLVAAEPGFVTVSTEPLRARAVDAVVVLRPGRAQDSPRSATFDAAIADLHTRSVPVLELTLSVAAAPTQATRIAKDWAARVFGSAAQSPDAGRSSSDIERTPQQLFAQAVALMKDTAAQPLTIAEVAGHLATSQKKLARAFHTLTGEAPLVHYRRLRVHAGVQRIRDSEDSITEIAHATGFADLPHFIRSVKAFTGRTPNSFRRARPAVLTQRLLQSCARVLLVGCPYDRSYSGYATLREFSNRLELRTAGRIRFEVVPFRSVGLRNVDTLRSVIERRFDAVLVLPEKDQDEPLFQTVVPQGILAEAGTNLDIAQMQEAVVTRILQHHGLGVLARLNGLGHRHIFLASRTPVATLQDLRQTTVQLWSAITARAFSRLGVPVRLDRPSTLRDALRDGVVTAGAGLSEYVATQAARTDARYLVRLLASTRNYPHTIACRFGLLETIPSVDLSVIQQISAEMMGEADLRWERDQYDADHVTSAVAGSMIDAGHAVTELRNAIQGAMLASWHDACRGLNSAGRRYFSELRDRVATSVA